MPKPDPAHKETDKILCDMEKRLDEVYKQAYREARQTADDFMKSFREMDKKKRQQVKDGELDKAEYERWRRTQVFQGNRYHQMADTLAADMTHTNQIAASVINGYLPEVYAVNHNYGTYEIEKGSRINTQYTMYDRQTVERLIRDNPDLLPRKAAVNVPKDQLWNKKHINSAVTQGILQGEAIDKIAQRLAATVTDMSHTSAIRNARTMTTSAQNGGRIDSYKRAEGMGIKMLQVWMATLDSRTRHEHRQLDGQKRKVGEAFEVEGEKIFFPGDPAADPALVYNCRCTLIGEVEGVDYNLSDVSQRDNKLGDMTYEEWKEEKQKAPKPPENVPEGKAVEVKVDKPAKGEYKEEKIKPRALTEDNEQTLREYTAGQYKYECGYADALLIDDEKERQSALDYLHQYQVGWYEEEKGIEFLEQQTREILETINSQPIDDIPLFRIERRSINKEMPFKEGDEISWGIRSTTRDENFITRVRNNEEEGFEEAFHDDLAPYIYEIIGDKKHLNIAEYSEFNQAESLVSGKFKVLSIEQEKIVRTVKKQTFEEAVKDFPDKFEFFTSKKGNEMVKINEQKTAVTLEKAKREVYYNGETNNYEYLSKYSEEERAEKFAAQIIKLVQIIE